MQKNKDFTLCYVAKKEEYAWLRREPAPDYRAREERKRV